VCQCLELIDPFSWLSPQFLTRFLLRSRSLLQPHFPIESLKSLIRRIVCCVDNKSNLLSKPITFIGLLFLFLYRCLFFLKVIVIRVSSINSTWLGKSKSNCFLHGFNRHYRAQCLIVFLDHLTLMRYGRKYIHISVIKLTLGQDNMNLNFIIHY